MTLLVKKKIQNISILGMSDKTHMLLISYEGDINADTPNFQFDVATDEKLIFKVGGALDTDVNQDGVIPGEILFLNATKEVTDLEDLRDLINDGRSKWFCRLLLPQDQVMLAGTTPRMIDIPAANVTDLGVDVFIDTTVADITAAVIGPEADTSLPAGARVSFGKGSSSKGGRDVENRPRGFVFSGKNTSYLTRVIQKAGNAGADLENTIEIHSLAPGGDTLLATRVGGADDVEKELDFTDTNAVFQARPNEAICVLVKHNIAGTANEPNATTLDVSGWYGPPGA